MTLTPDTTAIETVTAWTSPDDGRCYYCGKYIPARIGGKGNIDPHGNVWCGCADRTVAAGGAVEVAAKRTNSEAKGSER